MKIHYSFETTGDIRNAVVTTGSFDGVHQGHRLILERLKKRAVDQRGETVLITFYPHPRKVLYPDTYGRDLKLITTSPEKERLLADAGLDHLIIIPFTVAFASIEPSRFVEDILLQKLHARVIITGYNHHFGHNRAGDTRRMIELGKIFGFTVEEIPALEIHQESTSSVIIRQAITKGDILKANQHLGYDYMIMGREPNFQSTGIEEPSTQHFFQIDDEQKLIPPEGVYAVTYRDGERWIEGRCLITNSRHDPRDAGIEFRGISTVPIAVNAPALFFHDKIPE